MSPEYSAASPSKFHTLWLTTCFLFILGLGVALIWLPQSNTVTPVDLQKANATQPQLTPASPAPFDQRNATHLLTAFSLQGMQHVTDAESFSLLNPGSVIVAQLVQRDPAPVVLTDDIVMRYTIESPLQTHTNGTLQGSMKRHADGVSFESDPITILPYTPSGEFNPYPTALVEALDAQGTLLASTRITVPVSTEIGCRNCHTGPWKTAGMAGISAQTAGDILAVHDKYNNTTLQQQAAEGKQVDCRSCHNDKGKQVNISTAIHGFHATMQLQGADACASCHPSGKNSATHFQQDIHTTSGLNCTSCHGTLENHAVSLLRAESNTMKIPAVKRLATLLPRVTTNATTILPRIPWINLPDCASCHDFTQKPDPETASAFNKWTKSTDELYSRRLENTQQLRCASCHGAPHAIYPVNNPLDNNRGNLQPLQFQQTAKTLGSADNCGVCHIEPMEFSAHHDSILP